MDISIENCPICSGIADTIADQLNFICPLDEEGAPMDQGIAGVLAAGMYALGVLHGQGHVEAFSLESLFGHLLSYGGIRLGDGDDINV